MNLTEIALKYRLLTWIFIIFFLAAGSLSYFNMPRFEDPEFTIRTLQVVTVYPGAAPEDVANEVSDTIESEIQGMQEVDEIRSQNYFGLSIIEVDIKYAFSETKKDLQLVFTRLRNRVGDAERALPPGAGKPIVNDDYGDVFGLYYVITGSGFTLTELHEYAMDLRTDLLTVEDVAKIETLGNQTEAIYVEIARDRAAALGVSLENIFIDLSRQNSVVSAGNIQIGDQRLVIHPTGEITSVEAIANTVVSSGNDGNVIYLRDIATVTRGYVEPTRFLARHNGSPAIALGISNVSGTNVARLGEAIRAKLDETLGERPTGVQVEEFYHQGDIVNDAVRSFSLNVAAALVIVLITLFLFMGAQSAGIIGSVLVVTIAATLATMYTVGLPMHRISLGALIIALGMLVDNAIVIAEGILVGVKAGQRKLDVINRIVGRTKWALLGGTAVGIIAFAPIGFAPGTTAEYTNDLFWVIFISLGYSWLFAITIVPVLADAIFPEPTATSESAAKTNIAMWIYKKFLRGVLYFRWIVILTAIGLFSASIWGFQFVKSGFFPTSTTPQIAIDYWLPEGADIERTTADLARAEAYLGELEGVEQVHTLIGGGALRYMLIYSPQTPNPAFGQIILRMDGIGGIESLIPKLQAYFDDEFPNAQARVWRFQLGPSQGSKIEAVFSGPEPVVLRGLAAEARAVMNAESLATSVKTDWRQEVPVVEPRYAPQRGNRVGVSREDLANTLRTNYLGRTIGVYREGEDLIPIVYRAPENERFDLETVSSIQIPSRRTGRTVPISAAADSVQVVWRDGQLRREDRIWTIKVQSDPVSGVLASDLLESLRPKIEAIELPEGYALEWQGEFGDSTKANGQLASTIPFGVLAMVFVVVALFNALRQPIMIWLIVPLAIIGVVVGLILTGTPLEFMALLGVLSLSGLLIKNAIVLVDQIDQEIREGKPRYDAIIDSTASRVRPIMMGSLTTVLGVIPLMSDVFFRSMAVTIVFGLSFATLLTLVLLPALYATFFNVKSSERLAKA